MIGFYVSLFLLKEWLGSGIRLVAVFCILPYAIIYFHRQTIGDGSPDGRIQPESIFQRFQQQNGALRAIACWRWKVLQSRTTAERPGVYLSTVSNRLNAVMKQLAIIATVL